MLFGHIKAQPGALDLVPGPGRLPEPLEYVRQLILRYSDAAVCHCEIKLVRILVDIQGNMYVALVGRIFERVGDQVVHHGLHFMLVTVVEHVGSLAVERHLYLTGGRLRHVPGEDGPDEFGKIHHRTGELAAVAAVPLVVKHPAQEGVETLRVLHHHLQLFPDAVIAW